MLLYSTTSPPPCFYTPSLRDFLLPFSQFKWRSLFTGYKWPIYGFSSLVFGFAHACEIVGAWDHDWGSWWSCWSNKFHQGVLTIIIIIKIFLRFHWQKSHHVTCKIINNCLQIMVCSCAMSSNWLTVFDCWQYSASCDRSCVKMAVSRRYL